MRRRRRRKRRRRSALILVALAPYIPSNACCISPTNGPSSFFTEAGAPWLERNGSASGGYYVCGQSSTGEFLVMRGFSDGGFLLMTGLSTAALAWILFPLRGRGCRDLCRGGDRASRLAVGKTGFCSCRPRKYKLVRPPPCVTGGKANGSIASVLQRVRVLSSARVT